MPDLTNAIAVGTDGVVPIYNPESPWKMWGLHEIYRGAKGLSETGNLLFIPKLKDYAIDVDTYTVYIVDHLDPITLIPTLRQINPNGSFVTFSKTDVLFGVGPGAPSEIYRVYLDKSTTPYTLAVDCMLTVYGSAAKYAKIYRAMDTGDKIVSKVYDSRGQFISENVQLELVKLDSHETHVEKAVPVCYTTEDMPDGEVVSVVFYSDQGHVVSKRSLLVENTTFIPTANNSKKYVSHITLECVFISPTTPDLIDFPLNVPINALNLMGVVHYSDGSIFRTAVDGNKFKIFGLDQFTSSIVGQEIDLVLAYVLGSDEAAYAGVGLGSNVVTTPYTLRVVNPNNGYTVKVHGYPEWVSVSEGYRMKWWLMNLDRNIHFDVTNLIHFDETNGLFNPVGYGYVQQKAISINLRDISQAFKPFVHTQTVSISLLGTPDNTDTAWTVSSDVNVATPYGRQLRIKRTGVRAYNLISGALSKTEWINRFYYESQPLVDKAAEIKAPEPTHFTLMYNGKTVTYDINEWNQNLVLENELTNYSSVYILFTRRIGNQDLKLSIVGVMTRY